MPTQEIDLGNVQGPKGDTGPQGPQGAQGPEGPQGPPGEFDMDAGLSFTEATTRANINTGESLKTILGKIKKFFTDLKPHAFSNPVNNLTGTDASLPLAAPQGKALKQEIDELNSALTNKIISGKYNNASIIFSDVTLTFKDGSITIGTTDFDEVIGKTLVGAMAQLKLASAAVITSCKIIDSTTIQIKCSNLSGSAYSGDISATLLMIVV